MDQSPALTALFELKYNIEQDMPNVKDVQQCLISLADSMSGGGPEPRQEIIDADGYNIVVQAWKFFCNTGEFNIRVLTPEADLIREASLRVLYVMSAGFPKIIDAFGFAMIMHAFYNLVPEATKIYGLKFMRNICINNEENREKLAFEYLVAEPFVHLIKVDHPSSELVREWCGAFRTFLLNDDRSVAYNRVPERKRLIFENQAQYHLCQFLNLYDDEKTLNAIVNALALLASYEDYCVAIEMAGGLRGLNTVLENHNSNMILTQNVILCLRYLFASSIVREKGGTYPILKMVLYLADTNRVDVDFVEISLSCLAFLTIRNPCACAQFLVESGVRIVLDLMQLYEDAPQLLKSGSLILRNVASNGGKVGRSTIIEAGGENIIRESGLKHPDLIINHINPILRDLDREVMTPPLPTGEGSSNKSSGSGGRADNNHGDGGGSGADSDLPDNQQQSHLADNDETNNESEAV